MICVHFGVSRIGFRVKVDTYSALKPVGVYDQILSLSDYSGIALTFRNISNTVGYLDRTTTKVKVANLFSFII